MTSVDSAATGPLAAALLSAEPAAGLAAELATFGQFVGDWTLLWKGKDSDGKDAATMDGRLSVGWILGGAAVQDVWVVPAPARDAPGGLSGFHGTTVRFYDPTIQAWRSTWIDPPNARVRRFTGGPLRTGIELVSDEEEPLLRWSFCEITANSFRWTGEVRRHPDDDWTLQQEILATRTDAPGQSASAVRAW